MIALSVLQDAQKRILESTGRKRKIRCFFSEKEPAPFSQLQAAVVPFHKPQEFFEVKTYCGEFENAIGEIKEFIGQSFPLIFIDPTGWTGYPFDKIKPIFAYKKCEVLINFMYEFVNRFASSDDEETIASLNQILGGPGWRDRLDKSLSRGLAVEKLFRDTLKASGGFSFVVSTKIEKSTADRPHFFIAYGTKDKNGLIAFRETEYKALREHTKDRANAKERKREERSQTSDLFSGYQAQVQEATFEDIVEAQKELASQDLINILESGKAITFSDAVVALLQSYMLRETNIKDICVDLAKAGLVENTWGGGNRKPQDDAVIKLKTAR